MKQESFDKGAEVFFFFSTLENICDISSKWNSDCMQKIEFL